MIYSARAEKEKKLVENLQRQGVAESSFPQYGTNFWGNSANNYGFGNSNISQNIQNVTNKLNHNGFSDGMNNFVINKVQNNIQPRYWESAADGKQVYENVMKQEGNFTQPNQNMFNYVKSAIQGGMNIIGNFSDMKEMKVTDKYKHAMMNCNAAQYGQGGADIVTLASNLREWYEKTTGSNTLDSSNGDQYANKIGRLLGSKYPDGDCDELVQRYIEKNL